MAGLPVGALSAVSSALKSLAELGWDVLKLWYRLKVTPNEVASEIVQVVKSSTQLLLGNAESLGFHTGRMMAQEGTKLGIEFFNSSPFEQGYAFGKIMGRIIGEVALLFVGVGEVSAAAKALASTKYGRVLLEAMEASKLLKGLVESSEAAKSVKAMKAAEEAAEASKALKGAEEARPAAGLADESAKAGGATRRAEGAAAVAGKEVLPASARKEVITAEEAIVESNYIDAHPELVNVTDSPPRAKIGDHEVVQLPEGVCERRSVKTPFPCPVKLQKNLPKPSMLQKDPGKYMSDFELGRNMSASDRAYQIKCGGKPNQGYYVNGVQFDAFDEQSRLLVDAKNWQADGRIVKALEAGEHWAAWKVVNQAQDQLRAAKGFPIVWRVASKEAKAAIDPILKGWKFNISVVVVPP